ncbi:lipopolysaccharide biosynthesis protein [Streptomyces violascens]|uniref:lipopolysaccharide biosynthesis protein n=1 Tax=Streptomyces violascens TaxID=67381 RepID=UPI0036B4F4D3
MTVVPTAEGGLTGRAVRGMRWTLLGSVATFAVQIPYTAVLSRLLPPADFGLVALAMLMLSCVNYFAQGGLSSAVVQRDGLTERDVRTAFGLSLLTGSTGLVLVWFAAPFVVTLLAGPRQLIPVTQALAIAFTATALGATASGLLRRNMRYRAVAVTEFGSYVFGYCGPGLALALTGAGVWSLVAAAVGQSVLRAAWTYALEPHDPRPLFDRIAMAPTASFGAKVSGVGLLEFVNSNMDTALVGRFGGTAVLGQYSRAGFVATLPLEQLGTAASKVLLPALSRIQHERARLAAAYTDLTAVTTLLFLPLATFIAALSGRLVPLLLGARWTVAAALVPLLAASAVLGVIVHFPAVLAEALGQVGRKAVIQGARLVTVAVGAGCAVWWGSGVIGFALVMLGGRIVEHLLYVVWLRAVVGVSARSLAIAYGQGAAVAGLLAGTVAVVDRLGRPVLPAPVVAGCAALAGVAVAALVLRFGGWLAGVQMLRARGLVPGLLKGGAG